MAHLLLMPSVLAGASEATLVAWTVQPGDSFAVGDNLADVETDKAVVELAAEVDGTIGRLLVDEGSRVTVGDPIAVLTSAGDTEADIDAALVGVAAGAAADVADPSPETAAPEPAAADVVASETIADAPTPPTTTAGSTRVFMSPLVRRLAHDLGVDPATIPGTGPHGRIVRRDLEAWVAAQKASPAAPAHAAAAAPTAPGSFRTIEPTRMRRAIARRLTESTATVPHFYLRADLRAERLLDMREQVNGMSQTRVSINDLLVKAAAAAYQRVPEANVIWINDTIRVFDTVDVAVAVAIDGGLVTPVVRSVETLKLTQINATVRDLAERARGGRITQNELEGGALAISNLGMYGVQEFSAIINPPQSAILAVGASREAAVIDNGQIVAGQVISVTLSVDHRAMDGALAATWLAAFTDIVHNPVAMLL